MGTPGCPYLRGVHIFMFLPFPSLIPSPPPLVAFVCTASDDSWERIVSCGGGLGTIRHILQATIAVVDWENEARPKMPCSSSRNF